MRHLLMTLALSCYIGSLSAQTDTLENKNRKKRLDFAKTYLETGASYVPSFKGKQLSENQITDFDHSAAFKQYLTWGAFHFWGHAEFYVTFPLGRIDSKKKEDQTYELNHSVVTGARFFPLRMEEKKIRPYIGLSWGALDLKQKDEQGNGQPQVSKDFIANYDAGVLYNYKSLAVRLGLNYFPNTKWDYPITKVQKAPIKTPPLTAQFGFIYTFDLSKDTKKDNIEQWNSYPRLSKLSYDAQKFGDFFIGMGPSMSFSLVKSEYNKTVLPYLKERLTSNNYFDIATGYHFNKASLFTVLSFRNPKFKTEGYNNTQQIKKTSITLEVNKFLMDYSGFAPYIGINLAYDKIKYQEDIDGIQRTIKFAGKFEPGITAGWDIVPGKTNEALILRTNLRWYPRSQFEVDGKKFNFSQLEYNLIQLVFYPERLKMRK